MSDVLAAITLERQPVNGAGAALGAILLIILFAWLIFGGKGHR